MAKGRVHDGFNLFFGGAALATLIFYKFHSAILIGFATGFFFSSFLFSPDTDIRPKKRSGVLAFILFPYSFFSKHRGLSHSLFWGTITRVFYLLTMGLIIVFVLHRMNYMDFGVGPYKLALESFVRDYDYDLPFYKGVTWFLIGQFIADCCHLLVDKISDILP